MGGRVIYSFGVPRGERVSEREREGEMRSKKEETFTEFTELAYQEMSTSCCTSTPKASISMPSASNVFARIVYNPSLLPVEKTSAKIPVAVV